MNFSSEHRSGDILKQGYLLKKGRVSKRWKLGYFVLSKECLCYYQMESEWKENKPKELIFFNDMSLYIDNVPDKETKYCIKIVRKSMSNKIASRTYLLCCFSEEERNKWLSEILYAKATALVVDPKRWITDKNTPGAKGLNLHFPRSASSSERICGKDDWFRKMLA